MMLGQWRSLACHLCCLGLLRVAASAEHVELLQHQLTLHGTVGTTSHTPSAALPLTWFHIPKCGSSFVNVVAHQPGFCPGLEQNTTIDVDSFGDCFMQTFTHKTCSSRCDPTKLRCQGSVHECLGMHYEALKGHLVGMFRQPEQRILSFCYDIMDNDFDPCALTPALNFTTPECARKYHGSVVYQLVGEGTGENHDFPRGKNFSQMGPRTITMAEEAVRRVRNGFAFVGIVEYWDLSICLFHKMFGGHCLASEFENTRPGTHVRIGAEDMYDTAPLLGFRDNLDGMVYQEALRIFRENLIKYNVSGESCQSCFGQAS